MLRVEHIVGGYQDQQPIVKDVSFEVKKGTIVGILGPNGSGKSTLLKLISGLLPKQSGSVFIDDRPIQKYTSKQLARKMAVLPQMHAQTFSHTVRETVALGRYPHQTSFFSTWSQQDEQAVQYAMAQTGIEKYEYTELSDLSGGEQQRTFVAQALAQNAELLLLDEPTNHLDIEHQRQLMDLVSKEVQQCHLTVVSIFHDMNLASLYCDELILMEHGKIRAKGAPHEVLKVGQINEVYSTEVAKYPHPQYPKPQLSLIPSNVQQNEAVKVTLQHFSVEQAYVYCQAPKPLKVISSAMHNAGIGWYEHFINRTVPATYDCENAHEELAHYLKEQGFVLTNTVAMMTAVEAKHVILKEYEENGAHIVVAVTAGVGNAIDAARAYLQKPFTEIGTINSWVIVNGEMTNESLMHAMITATEAKVKALADEQIVDKVSNTIATGTSTDSLLIGATQCGTQYAYAGTATEIGKLIGRGVYEATVEALQDYKRAKGMIEC